MADDDPRDRFSGLGDLKDEYEGTTDDGNDEQDSKDGNDVSDENDSMTDVASSASNDGIDSNDSEDSTTGTDGKDGVKASRENVQAYIPADEKEELETAFRQIKALCNLADRDEPLKNDFYAAAFRHGHQDLEAIAAYLDLEAAYDEYGEMVS
ncbi:hypothetical protein SAMN06269185_3294 [Natronoarchaeum philippinense]|uniref:DUF8160 domain-containing protein n=1 Tax=Natronoarchaeum philippinense TaxID=558529 RepID=A0A285PAC8_NATPI|nr:hypothetical protein [Natronoarchaeum philippinense]SNZ18207.1 hypothetical protein SAMN06269185_3294 [Natronoarchaeum philippinense]